MRSTAAVKSFIATVCAWRRVAASAASLTRLARSAPLKPGVSAATLSSDDRGVERDLAHVHLQDVDAALAVGPVDQHLAVEATGAQQRRVEDLGPVGRRQNDQAHRGVEAVHLGEQLVERLFLLVVPAESAVGAARAAERVELVDEDDRRRAAARLLEQVAHARRADADEHLDELAARDREERHPGFAGHRLGQQRLAGARRAHQQHAARDVRAQAAVLLAGASGSRPSRAARRLASSTPATSAKVTPVSVCDVDLGAALADRSGSRPSRRALPVGHAPDHEDTTGRRTPAPARSTTAGRAAACCRSRGCSARRTSQAAPPGRARRGWPPTSSCGPQGT